MAMVIAAVPALPPHEAWLDDTLHADLDIPVWDGTPFDVAYAIDVLYNESAALGSLSSG